MGNHDLLLPNGDSLAKKNALPMGHPMNLQDPQKVSYGHWLVTKLAISMGKCGLMMVNDGQWWLMMVNDG